MTYKAQLVVRSRTKDGSAIIEKVKELASEQGKTYSEMAVELIGRGLNADASTEAAPVTEDVDSDPSSASEAEAAEAVAVVAEPVKVKKKASPHPKAPLPPEEAGPKVDPGLPPEEILEHYLERREERGERAAARILVDFFAEAGPGKGGNLKKLLQKQFSAAEFDELMEPIKATSEYSTYMSRAISKPSPYSEAK